MAVPRPHSARHVQDSAGVLHHLVQYADRLCRGQEDKIHLRPGAASTPSSGTPSGRRTFAPASISAGRPAPRRGRHPAPAFRVRHWLGRDHRVSLGIRPSARAVGSPCRRLQSCASIVYGVWRRLGYGRPTAPNDLRRVRGFLAADHPYALGGRLCSVSPKREYALRVVPGADGVESVVLVG
jgi:hypothetical protein